MSQRFTGADVTAASISFTGTGAFAVCAWVYVQNATAGDFCYLDPAGGGSGGDAIWLGFEPTNYRFQNRVSGVGFDVSSALTLNQWHHVAMTFDGTNTTAWKDGAIVSGPTATSLGGRGTMNHLDIGFGGDFTIQDAFVFSQSLTAAQIADCMKLNAPSGVSPYAWYKLTNASPTTDSSGNSHTLSGAGNSNGVQIIIAGIGTVNASGSVAAPASSALSAVGTVRTSGTSAAAGSAALSATGTTLTSGSASAPGSAAVTASSTTIASGSASAPAGASVSAIGTVLTSGQATASSSSGPGPSVTAPLMATRRNLAFAGRRAIRY